MNFFLIFTKDNYLTSLLIFLENFIHLEGGEFVKNIKEIFMHNAVNIDKSQTLLSFYIFCL